ncbi:MAG: hypothetical protein ACXAEL_16470, partial [Candidatus Hodarchaeales archaeon]
YAMVADHIQVVRNALISAVGSDILSPQMETFLNKGVEYTIRKNGSFRTLFEVLSDKNVEEILGIRGVRADVSCLALINRLERIISGTGGQVWNVTTSNVTMDMLLNNNVILDMSAYEAAEDVSGRRILLDVLSHLLYNYLLKRRSPISETSDELRNVLLADEVQKLAPRKLSKRFTDESSLFAKVSQTVRAFGMACIYAGVAPTVEDTILSQSGSTVIFYSKARHDLKSMAGLVGMEESEFHQLVTGLQDREAVVKTPNADAYIIKTIDTPVTKMTEADWDLQRAKWEQDSTRQLYEQTQFNIVSEFQDKAEIEEEWNPRKNCELYCLDPSNCLGISDVAMARTAKILREKTLREWLTESLQDVEFPLRNQGLSPPKIHRVWKQLERENRKDTKSPIPLPIRSFCSSIHFLREVKGLSSSKLESIRDEFIHLAKVAYIDELSLLAQNCQTTEAVETPSQAPEKPKPETTDETPAVGRSKGTSSSKKSPLAILTRFVKGNITEVGFFTQQEATQFFMDRKLGRLSDFSSNLKRAIQAARKALGCQITKVAVPSFTGTKLSHIYAKEMDPKRKNSFERAIHRYFIVEISRALQEMGHTLKRTHKFPDGQLDDICVESSQTGRIGRIEIKTGNCANLRKGTFPQTKEAYLIIVPWRSKILRRRAKAAIPLAQLNHLQPII